MSLQHHKIWKHQFFRAQVLFMVQLSHPHMTIGKTIALTEWNFVGNMMCLLFNMLSRFVPFLPRSKCILISWLQSPSAVILKPKKIKSVTVCIVSPSICHEVMGPDAINLVFWMLSFKPAFSLSSFTFIKRLFSSSSLYAIRVVSSAYLRLFILQPWCTPYPILNQSIVPCPVLTAASWPSYRFFRKQVRSSGIPIAWRIFHSLLWSTQSKALA